MPADKIFSMISPRFIGLCLLGMIAASSCDNDVSSIEIGEAGSARSPNCITINSCIQILTGYRLDPDTLHEETCGSGVVLDHVGNALAKLMESDREAVEALIPLLGHEHCQVRKRAALAIHYNGSIFPEDYAVLAEAYERGVPWLEVPISLTQTEASLDLLWLGFLKDPSEFSNLQTIMGLARYGDRIQSKALPLISECMSQLEDPICTGLIDLANFSRGFPPSTKPFFEALSQQPSLSELQRLKAQRISETL